jgi:hypothetical protein
VVFVNRHLKVPKWFKEWYDKLDPPKEMYSKIPYKKVPYAIGKVVYADKFGINVWNPMITPSNYLYREDWHPKNIDMKKTSRCTTRNQLYLIEALMDKSLAMDEVNVNDFFDLNKNIEKILLKGECLENIQDITYVAVSEHSAGNCYDVPRKLRDGFVTEIQTNYLPYVIYLLDQNKEDPPKWK